MLRERARTLEAERAALTLHSSEVHGLASKIAVRLHSIALEDGNSTPRPYASQFAAIQVR